MLVGFRLMGTMVPARPNLNPDASRGPVSSAHRADLYVFADSFGRPHRAADSAAMVGPRQQRAGVLIVAGDDPL
jgi:hypothetical protein